jgi:hypothetical protein
LQLSGRVAATQLRGITQRGREEGAMKMILELLPRGAVGLVLVSLAAGCASPVDRANEAGEPAATENLGQTEESLTSVNMLDCSICDTARECCNAVSAANGTSASSCMNFDGPRCATLDPGRQKTTKLNCLVYLRTVITAWGRMPPSVCRIPGE